MKLDKNKFDCEIEEYIKTPLFTEKSLGYKNGFKDALHLAWQIFSENDAEEED